MVFESIKERIVLLLSMVMGKKPKKIMAHF